MNIEKKSLCAWCKKNCKKSIVSWVANKLRKNKKDPINFVDLSKFIVETKHDNPMVSDGAKKLAEKKMGVPLEIPKNFLKLGKNIGEGQFGKVFVGTYFDEKKQTLEDVAIKSSKQQNDLLLEEIVLMNNIENIVSKQRIDSSNIVKFFGCVTKNNNCMVVMEYCKNGDLNKYVQNYNIPMDISFGFMIDIAKGLECLFRCNIIHNDLACRNILVDTNPNGQLICKISDYGLSKSKDTTTKISDLFPIRWTAPEVLEDMNFSFKSDIWSFGMVIIEIITHGVKPYNNYKNMSILSEKIIGGLIPNKPIVCSLELYNFLKICWKKDPKKRPTPNICIKHLSELRNQNLSAEQNHGAASDFYSIFDTQWDRKRKSNKTKTKTKNAYKFNYGTPVKKQNKKFQNSKISEAHSRYMLRKTKRASRFNYGVPVRKSGTISHTSSKARSSKRVSKYGYGVPVSKQSRKYNSKTK